VVLTRQHQRHVGDRRGQGRSARLAPGPGGDGRRSRLLQRREPALPHARGRALDRRRAHARRQPGRAGRAVAPGSLSDRQRAPARQGGPRRLRRRGQALHHLPQPRRGRARTHRARDETIHRLRAGLERIETQRAKAKSANARAAHTRTECALRDHPALGRYLRQTTTGRLRIDRAKITAEERLDGKFLLSPQTPTSPPKTSRSATRTCSQPNAASAI
jgi:hypothetical protein